MKTKANCRSVNEKGVFARTMCRKVQRIKKKEDKQKRMKKKQEKEKKKKDHLQ